MNAVLTAQDASDFCAVGLSRVFCAVASIGPRKGATLFSISFIQPSLQRAQTTFTFCSNRGMGYRSISPPGRIISPVPIVFANCGNSFEIHSGTTCSLVVGVAPQKTHACVATVFSGERLIRQPLAVRALRGFCKARAIVILAFIKAKHLLRQIAV